MRAPIDLADEPRDGLLLFFRRAFELAVSDYDDGPRDEGQRTGRDVLAKCGVGNWRGFHEQLASTVYNKTIWSLRAVDELPRRD